jgi:hypothetical protein
VIGDKGATNPFLVSAFQEATFSLFLFCSGTSVLFQNPNSSELEKKCCISLSRPSSVSPSFHYGVVLCSQAIPNPVPLPTRYSQSPSLFRVMCDSPDLHSSGARRRDSQIPMIDGTHRIPSIVAGSRRLNDLTQVSASKITGVSWNSIIDWQGLILSAATLESSIQ